MNDQVESIDLQSCEPAKLAEWVLTTRFSDERGRATLFYWRDVATWFEWYGGKRWVPRRDEDVADVLWEVLEDAETVKETVTSRGARIIETTRVAPTQAKVADVLRAMQAKRPYPYQQAPAWLNGQGHGDPRLFLAFEDVVLDLAHAAEVYRERGVYEWKVLPRDCDFFSMYSVQCKWNPEAVCPVWEQCLEQWAMGDEHWGETHERCLGVAISSIRWYERLQMQYGPPRGGKKLATQVPLIAMLGKGAVIGRPVLELLGDFGLDGLESAAVVVASEAQKMSPSQRSRFGSVAKVIAGQDPISVRKFQKGLKDGIVLPCFMIVQSNDLVEIDNSQRSVTAKVVAQPFDNCFLGKEDVRLAGKVEAEVEGVARRCVEALVRLLAEQDPHNWFVMSKRAQGMIRKFEGVANLFNRFLDDMFEPDPEGWLSLKVVRSCREIWEGRTGYELVNEGGKPLSDQRVGEAIVKFSTWSVGVVRKTDEDGQRGWGLKGVRIKRNSDARR